ncbi:diguanylate cyclase [Paenibacillus sp. YPG26]|uniref:GGDEF domain-containing protein n=1 Tax=Paenibacillus sp. YPG26 TaxID=2878915 RepID=UPI00203E4E1F|nr:diguanylate cyclase [Paenibacillus sp. YPG26]USB32668.1 diguanylate cyclase [Paenibacillus sp. YPG26]
MKSIAEGEKMWWISFLSGMSLSVLLMGFGMRIWRGGSSGVSACDARTVALVEGTRDIVYYLELEPVRRYRYVYAPLNRLIEPECQSSYIAAPETVFLRIHPEDLALFYQKLNGELDLEQPLLYRIRDCHGQYVWYEELATPVYDQDKLVAIQGIVRSVQDRLDYQQYLEYRLAHDSMTGLFNREHFEILVSHYDVKEDIQAAIIICDMDNLKYVNDNFGHMMGDLYIKEAAGLLREIVSDDVMVCRVGGDEFAILVANKTLDEVSRLVRGLRQRVIVFRKERPDLNMDISLGYAYSEHSLQKMDYLFLEADREMYRIKNSKKLVRT